MTYLSPIQSTGLLVLNLQKEVLMDKRSNRPVVIRFSSPKECIDYTIKMELKYFLAKLIYSHYNKGV